LCNVTLQSAQAESQIIVSCSIDDAGVKANFNAVVAHWPAASLSLPPFLSGSAILKRGNGDAIGGVTVNVEVLGDDKTHARVYFAVADTRLWQTTLGIGDAALATLADARTASGVTLAAGAALRLQGFAQPAGGARFAVSVSCTVNGSSVLIGAVASWSKSGRFLKMSGVSSGGDVGGSDDGGDDNSGDSSEGDSVVTCGGFSCPAPLMRAHFAKVDTRCNSDTDECVKRCCEERLVSTGSCGLTNPTKAAGGSHCVDQKVCTHSGRTFERYKCARKWHGDNVCCYVPSGN
jgi:hypothetical protein